ncbi:MAG: VCBS repeat-containing protein, partial [Terriglobia bacterium]
MAMLAAPVARAGTPTTTTLALSASSVTAGTVVTFTASVTNPSPVTIGLVTFCDATATYCENSAIIGTAQLTSAGTAIIKLVPGVGNHSYVAVFNGTPFGTTANQASTSSPQALTVTGGATTTTISSSGSVGNYTLTGTVVGTGSFSLSPTGTVSFLDTSNGNNLVGSATLGTATLAQAFGTQVPYATGSSSGPISVAIGDFNGDGIPDLAVADFTSSNVSILLGNGDGTFQTAVNYPVATNPRSVVVGDFNGDGKLDLAVASYTNSNNVTILLGNGDGTFTTKGTFTAGSSPRSVAVGDFNGDGIPDLAVANYGGSTVSVLLGNGDGTFTTATNSPYTTGFSSPTYVAVGDFNRDGFADLVVANAGSNNVVVLLNNADGTGTFTAQTPSTVGSIPWGVAIGDFNGDGWTDLAVANCTAATPSACATGATAGTVSVLLNKADGTGTFNAAVPYDVGTGPLRVAVGDVNGDGIADLAVSNYNNGNAGSVSVLIGIGDGTFTPSPPTVAPTYATGN